MNISTIMRLDRAKPKTVEQQVKELVPRYLSGQEAALAIAEFDCQKHNKQKDKTVCD